MTIQDQEHNSNGFKKYLLVTPRISIQKGDFLGSGVPYWPVEIATLASFIREKKDSVEVVDLFGGDPFSLEDKGNHYLQGVPFQDTLTKEKILNTDFIIIYALSYMSHGECLEITAHIKRLLGEKKTPIAILENSQAVTAYAVPHVATSFFNVGASLLICGEPYWNWDEVLSCAAGKIPAPENVLLPGAADGTLVKRKTNKTPSFPIPAWDLFNLKNYWAIPYSHGPKAKRFLPIITSRGCPYPCDFCVVPETNVRLWRGRPAEEVVHEIVTLRDKFGVTDFQLEDLNPTVKNARMESILNKLIEIKAGIRFCIVSGTKAETVPLEMVPLYARGGCKYISISPESGSTSVMEAIGKPFNYDHGEKLVAACREHGIRTQACFIVGHPSETNEDFQRSESYLKKLVRAGLDEVAVFVVAPFAGSKLFQRKAIHLEDPTEMVSFSPKGRSDYEVVEFRRKTLIKIFFTEKLKKGFDLWLQGLRSILGTPQTKMENLPKRIFFIYWLVFRHWLSRKPACKETILSQAAN